MINFRKGVERANIKSCEQATIVVILTTLCPLKMNTKFPDLFP